VHSPLDLGLVVNNFDDHYSAGSLKCTNLVIMRSPSTRTHKRNSQLKSLYLSGND
jgi:hypothetical protein